MDDGYIKYNICWTPEQPVIPEWIEEVNFYRNLLYKKNLIGEDMGIGYGNISIRHPIESSWFIITGTQTGKEKKLDNTHYCSVTYCDFSKNKLYCKGPIKASSESLTHGIVYKTNMCCKAVMHVHHSYLWKKLLNSVPTTHKEVQYGSIGMVNEVGKLVSKMPNPESGLIAMAGHENGLISFGNTLRKALSPLLFYL